MPSSFVLAMFVMPVAIIGAAFLLAWLSGRNERDRNEGAR